MRQSRKGSATSFILEKIGELGMVGLEAFFPRNYAYTRVSRSLFGMDRAPKMSPFTLASILSRLAREGLVERKGKRGSSTWQLTKKGARRIDNAAPYILVGPPKQDGISRLVIFDVPERERRKRDVIRIELVANNFQQLQKSVWIGHNPLPQDFISLIDELHLGNNVHIFSVHKKGTLGGWHRKSI